MRIRRKPWARPELEACGYFIENPAELKGKWRKRFEKENPLHIELGCGKGSFIAQLASQNQEINYIAIDLKDEMLGLAKRNIEKLYIQEKRAIRNILLTAYNIEQITEVFGIEDGPERIYINFCNPWPRGKHNKRRLTHTRQLEKYKTFLKPGAEIYFKTDDDELFKASQEYFKETGFEIHKLTYDLHNEPIWENNIVTEHEKMFTEKGIKIKACIAKKIR